MSELIYSEELVGNGATDLYITVTVKSYAWIFYVSLIYFWFIKKSSNQIDLIEEDYKTGDKKIKKKWFDTTIQAAFIVTGCMLRMAYVMYFILPE